MIDPALDEPVTALGFVASCDVGADGDAVVHLRLPTHQCAPNFAYLMVADACAAIEAVPGVRGADVVLDDHMTGEEITGAVRAVRAGAEFSGAFPGELDELRSLFRRKALVARQSRVAEGLRGADLAALTLSAPARLPRREALPPAARAAQTAHRPGAPAFVRPEGTPVGADEINRWLRLARLVCVRLEGNGSLCRGLLSRRYGIPDPEETVAA